MYQYPQSSDISVSYLLNVLWHHKETFANCKKSHKTMFQYKICMSKSETLLLSVPVVDSLWKLQL